MSFYPDDAYLPYIRFLELALDGEYPNCTTDYVLIGEWKSHKLASAVITAISQSDNS